MDPVPPIYQVPELGIKKSVILSSIAVAFLILAIPIGVYLTRQQQNLNSEASMPGSLAPVNSLSLSAEKQATPSDLVVDLYTRADIDSINLINAKINYPADILEPDSIATDSADLKAEELQVSGKWIEADFEKQAAMATITVGIPNPGFKTQNSDPTKYLVARLKFKVKKTGLVKLTFEPAGIDMLRNSDTLNVLNDKKDLTLSLTEAVTFTPSSTVSATIVSLKNAPKMNLESPLGGEVYRYFDPVEIKWSGENVDKVTIGLLLNGTLYGNLATNIANTGNFSWKPSATLPLTYINQSSTFEIKLTGFSKDKLQVTDMSQGPFGLVAQTDAKVSDKPKLTIERVQADINNDNKIDVTDLSLLLANFNKQSFEPNMDFNQDLSVNYIDLFLLKNAYLAEKNK